MCYGFLIPKGEQAYKSLYIPDFELFNSVLEMHMKGNYIYILTDQIIFMIFRLTDLTPCGSITHCVTQPSVLNTSAHISVHSFLVLFPQETTHTSEAWGMSVKASHGAPLGVGIILVGEGASPDSRLCPDFFFFLTITMWKQPRETSSQCKGYLLVYWARYTAWKQP